VRSLAARLIGSPDLYAHKRRSRAEHQLRDVPRRVHAERPRVVQRKHNEANGEDNRDGGDDNRSWNCGVEGPTDDPEIERCARARRRTSSRCSARIGTPMLLMGDEVRRTQRGNNNAYCQTASCRGSTGRWWSATPICSASRECSSVADEPAGQEPHQPDADRAAASPAVTWHGVRLNEPDMGHDSHTLAATVSMAAARGCS
jgi:glycogen operon protein